MNQLIKIAFVALVLLLFVGVTVADGSQPKKEYAGPPIPAEIVKEIKDKAKSDGPFKDKGGAVAVIVKKATTI